MIIEKHKLYNIKAKPLLERNTNDFIEDNLDAVKLRKLSKKSEKIHDLSKERNVIEEKRLEFLKQLMKKRQGHVDNRWNMDYLKTRKALNSINEKTVSKSDFENTSISRLPTAVTTTSSAKDNNNCSSTLSLFATNSILIQSENTTISTRSFTSTQLSKIFTNKAGRSDTPCRYNEDNCFSRLHAMSQMSEDPKSEASLKEFSSPSTCSLFPCAPLRSYTSILGEKNDRRVKTAPARMETKRNGFRFQSQANTEPEIEIENAARTEQELSMQQVEHFQNHVSIRRPLRQTHSLRDFQFKINALEEQAKFCKEQNFATFKPADRNIRYGEPMERKKIFRQLKILAEFDRSLA